MAIASSLADRPGPTYASIEVTLWDTVDPMRLAGLDVPTAEVLELATTLRRADHAHAADPIEGAVAAGRRDAALTIPDRTAIQAAWGASRGARRPGARRTGLAVRPR